MQTKDVGEVATLTSKWWDTNGDAAEPSTIDLTVTHPDGSTDVYAKNQLTPGPLEDGVLDNWTKDIVGDAVGVWRFTFIGDIDGHPVEQSDVFLVGVGSSSSPSGPCEPWATWDDVVECTSTLTDVSPQQQEYALDIASEILFNLSGRAYSGICTTTRSLCLSCRSCRPVACSCEPVNGIDLGIAAPVWGVWDVVVDGVTLPASAYRLHDRRWLVRTDHNSWPYYGSSAKLLDPMTFRATWAFGRPIPIGGRKAAALFAGEVAKLCTGDESCALPQRVTNIQREGVSYTILDSMKMIEEGRTGLMLVDLWLEADRRSRKAKPRFFAPGAMSGVRRIA